MKNAVIALFIFSTIVSLAGAYVRGRFICADDQPIVSDLKAAWDFERRLYIGFFVIAGLGLVFAMANALVFSVAGFGDAVSFWFVAAAITWFSAVSTLFVSTYSTMQKTKSLFGPW